MLVEVKALEHHPHFHTDPVDIFSRIREVMAVNNDGTGINGLQLVNGAQQSGLAGSGRAEYHHFFSRGHIKTDVIQGLKRSEILIDILNADNRISVFHNG